ncbi:major facilitator superfamily domain-containing protein [Apiospora hydei]|uniref:Major facilitator superfamily domain-containing protein n=1 Tax=Apiospora hydei TaxID=1337664 RepID=A0ABR1WRN1_9PEZI
MTTESNEMSGGEKKAAAPDASQTTLENGQQTNPDIESAPPAPAQPQAGPPPAPNGGITAWLQVLGAFMIFFNSWGILNTFGVYQTYYESGQLFTTSSSNISWIGSIQAYLVLLGGLIAGPFYDKGYIKTLLTLGGFGVVFGHMMLSLVHTYWQALLAQGFCIGLGAGAMFVPAISVLPGYFNTRLGLAMGLAASGSSFGGIIYPIAFYRLVNQIGFGWSVRVLGFIALATMMIPIFFMKIRVKPPGARARFDTTIFTDIPFLIYIFGSMLGFIGLYVMLFYLSYFSAQQGITDSSLSFYLVAILNAASMFGRTLPNALSDKTGPLNLVIPGAFVCGILNLVMLKVHTVGGVIVVALAFGFFSGSKIGSRMGLGFALSGLGTLAGGPGGGGILGMGENPDWRSLWIYGGVCSLAGGVIFIGLRIQQAGLKLAVKV